MKQPAFTLVATSLLIIGSSAFANAELAQTKMCLACHTLDKKLVGPAFKDVAEKYAGKKGAAASLANKIIKGGSGVWGQVPMPPNAQVSEAEARQLAEWVLSTR